MEKYFEQIKELSKLKNELLESKNLYEESKKKYMRSAYKCEHELLGHLGIDYRPRLAGQLDYYMCLCCGKTFSLNKDGTFNPKYDRVEEVRNSVLLEKSIIINCESFMYMQQFLLDSFTFSYIEEKVKTPEITLEQFCSIYNFKYNLGEKGLKLIKK